MNFKRLTKKRALRIMEAAANGFANPTSGKVVTNFLKGKACIDLLSLLDTMPAPFRMLKKRFEQSEMNSTKRF